MIRGREKNLGIKFSIICTIVIISFVAIATPVYLNAAPGECALDFLNIPVGAYRASLGQGGLAMIEGPQAIFSNPAHIGRRTGTFASYQSLLLDTRSEAAAAGIPLNENYSLGFGIHVFQPGEIEGYTSDDVNTGTVRSGDYMVRLGISGSGIISYGISISYYSQRLDNNMGNGFGFGLGISREFSLGRLAFTADNIGPDFKIGSRSAPLPQRLAISAWAPLSSNFINLVADFSYRRNIGYGFSGGLEYSPISGFYLRTGANSDSHVSFGLGLVKSDFYLDYSYLPSDLFGDRHLFSFSLIK